MNLLILILKRSILALIKKLKTLVIQYLDITLMDYEIKSVFIKGSRLIDSRLVMPNILI